MMAQQVILAVRPGEVVRFPALCVACGQPAAERLTIGRRQGQTAYRLDVPVCTDCLRLSQRRSGREETLVRVGWLAAGVGALLAFALIWLVAGSLGSWGRLAAALIAALAAAGLAYLGSRRAAEAAELPEKRAVVEAAQISNFSWRDVTLSLASANLAEQVAALNGPEPEPTAGDHIEEQNA